MKCREDYIKQNKQTTQQTKNRQSTKKDNAEINKYT